MKRLNTLNAYRSVKGNERLETDWATGTYLSVIRLATMRDDVRKFAAYIGHFSDPENERLKRYLLEARMELGHAVHITLRGGAAILQESDDHSLRNELRAHQQNERAHYLRLFQQRFIEQEMDISWAVDNEAVKIIYDAATGKIKEMTETLDESEPIDFDDIPKGLFEE